MRKQSTDKLYEDIGGILQRSRMSAGQAPKAAEPPRRKESKPARFKESIASKRAVLDAIRRQDRRNNPRPTMAERRKHVEDLYDELDVACGEYASLARQHRLIVDGVHKVLRKLRNPRTRFQEDADPLIER